MLDLNLVDVVENETFEDRVKWTKNGEKKIASNIILTCGLNIISKCCGTRGPWTVPDRTRMVARCLL